ncbi:hypothetical protein BKA70DRAFT_721356 [Coprinopsis sp. MPI-PUGE-AT-0042]|nr:hypothetical protein BKA70DRAFT_721356 [Coprinopsis sp. MPI-PUGE-AT-0042]
MPFPYPVRTATSGFEFESERGAISWRCLVIVNQFRLRRLAIPSRPSSFHFLYLQVTLITLKWRPNRNINSGWLWRYWKRTRLNQSLHDFPGPIPPPLCMQRRWVLGLIHSCHLLLLPLSICTLPSCVSLHFCSPIVPSPRTGPQITATRKTSPPGSKHSSKRSKLAATCQNESINLLVRGSSASSRTDV